MTSITPDRELSMGLTLVLCRLPEGMGSVHRPPPSLWTRVANIRYANRRAKMVIANKELA